MKQSSDEGKYLLSHFFLSKDQNNRNKSANQGISENHHHYQHHFNRYHHHETKMTPPLLSLFSAHLGENPRTDLGPNCSWVAAGHFQIRLATSSSPECDKLWSDDIEISILNLAKHSSLKEPNGSQTKPSILDRAQHSLQE